MCVFGAWIHDQDGPPLSAQIKMAYEAGIRSVRSYSLSYSKAAAPVLREYGMSLYAGMHVDAEALLRDWRTQVRLNELQDCLQLGVPFTAICVGNELREFGNDPDKKRFTARISFGLANVIAAYRRWLDERGSRTPLTYAMEGIVLDKDGVFHEHLWPLIDACDIISINLYPMGHSAWHGAGQFEESRAFLRDARVRNDRLLRYEVQLRGVLAALAEMDKPVILSETGFPSALGYEKDARGLIVPCSDHENFGRAMRELLNVIAKADADYGHPIKAVYFYEWRDNLHHVKITNAEHSPIHCAFGLCDRFGRPKFDIGRMLADYRRHEAQNGTAP